MKNCEKVKSFRDFNMADTSCMELGPQLEMGNDYFTLYDNRTNLQMDGFIGRVVSGNAEYALDEAKMHAAAGLAGVGPDICALYSCTIGGKKRHVLVFNDIGDTINLEKYYRTVNGKTENQYLELVVRALDKLYNAGITKTNIMAHDFAINTTRAFIVRFDGGKREAVPVPETARNYAIRFGSSTPLSRGKVIVPESKAGSVANMINQNTGSSARVDRTNLLPGEINGEYDRYFPQTTRRHFREDCGFYGCDNDEDFLASYLFDDFADDLYASNRDVRENIRTINKAIKIIERDMAKPVSNARYRELSRQLDQLERELSEAEMYL